MEYSIPNMDLNETLKFSKSLNKVIPSDEMIFDFSKMHQFYPLPMLMIGSIIRNYQLNYPSIPFKVTWSDDIGKGYAGTMGFFKYISEKIKIGKMPGEAHGSSNYIPITPIKFNELQKIEVQKGNNITIGDLMDKEANKLSKVVARNNDELHKLLTYLIREIMRNTPEHAKTDKLWICGQYWKSYNFAEIAILDEGIGIYNSIRQNKFHSEYIKDNLTALEWSLKAGISDTFKPSSKPTGNDVWLNSGFGLFMVSEICKHLKGSFCLISYNNYILIDNNGVKTGSTYFKGTAIQIKVPFDEKIHAQDIINKIASEGTKQSRSIRNAFKEASLSSKGLIDIKCK